MELEIMNGITSEIFQSNDENIQLSLEKKDKVDQDLGELVFNGKNCSNRIPQLKPTQKSSDLVALVVQVLRRYLFQVKANHLNSFSLEVSIISLANLKSSRS